MKRFMCGILVVFLMGIALTGCSGTGKSLEGEWERADAQSPLYGTVIKIEKTDEDTYVGKIVTLTDTGKDAGFKTGDTKWANIKQSDTDNQYTLDDLTINGLDGGRSRTEMAMQFDSSNANELKLTNVEEDSANLYGSNYQTYRRK